MCPSGRVQKSAKCAQRPQLSVHVFVYGQIPRPTGNSEVLARDFLLRLNQSARERKLCCLVGEHRDNPEQITVSVSMLTLLTSTKFNLNSFGSFLK